jgi:hypothetical protein
LCLAALGAVAAGWSLSGRGGTTARLRPLFASLTACAAGALLVSLALAAGAESGSSAVSAGAALMSLGAAGLVFAARRLGSAGP